MQFFFQKSGVFHKIAPYNKEEMPVKDTPSSLNCNGSEAHAARGRDGRQEGRERGYYDLHRDLNHSFLHGSLMTNHRRCHHPRG